MTDKSDVIRRLVNAKTYVVIPKYVPTITKMCRLRNVNEGHYEAYFDIRDYRDADGEVVLEVRYLPNVFSDPYHHYYKSTTKKAGGFIVIKDICEKYFGPEPEEGWYFALMEIARNDDGGWARYKILEKS